MDNARKKEIAREYRERPLQAGVFAVVCRQTGQRWISSTRNLDKQQNSVWFQLRMGNHMNKPLQAAWNVHGEAGFAYEIVEEVKDDNALLIDTLLKERDAHWRKELGAEKLVG
jgi:hypothetical protein